MFSLEIYKGLLGKNLKLRNLHTTLQKLERKLALT